MSEQKLAGKVALVTGKAPADAGRTVSMKPGETLLAVMPSLANSTARPRVNPEIPALETRLWTRVGVPTCHDTPPMVTIRPGTAASSKA